MKRCLHAAMFFAAGILLLAAPVSAEPAARAAYANGASSDNVAGIADDGKGIASAPSAVRRITLGERLLMQNAVCALWADSMKQQSAPAEDVDIASLEAPDHIFVSSMGGFFLDNGEWVFEGLVRQMSPDSGGIEVISGMQSVHVRFTRHESGRLRITSIQFRDLGQG